MISKIKKVASTYLYNAPGLGGVINGDVFQAIFNALLPGTPLGIPHNPSISHLVATDDVVSLVGLPISTPVVLTVEPQYQGLRIVPLTEHTRTGLVDLANDNIAYRYALMHLNPFAVTGRDDLYDRHNDMDQLERYEETTQEGELTPSNLQDRAEFLVLLNQMNLNDASVSGRRREFNELELDIITDYQCTGDEDYHRYKFGIDDANVGNVFFVTI
ncbi:MAG: hypothetical protein KZQ94_01260 [Candidatus Thiodiazotropha sp. (ex Troendleina suluensis)]|nr:hypothetical protein [Candidatus Thiodiazotropha sp. (ex Troendleina suluensis)]